MAERFTEKNLDIGWDNKYSVKPSLFSERGFEAIDKLGKLEDIEDELGIDLLTLSKALANGIWVKLEYFGCKTTNIVFEKAFYFGKVIDEEKPVIRAECREYYLKDYGKTWALTKEELERGEQK